MFSYTLSSSVQSDEKSIVLFISLIVKIYRILLDILLILKWNSLLRVGVRIYHNFILSFSEIVRKIVLICGFQN